MAETHFSALLKKKLVDAIEQKAGSLASGSAQDYAQYQLAVGEIHGLSIALSLCEELDGEK